ncbi:ABC-F family ATP-binding cassette domain-containing protein [Dokdonella koreensis]|uniref:ABC-type transporter n=1 Tax=Dokdonella koreensis DS-123 TaxID=1300342 RepID=A0A160DW49_9GAMM|nr:ABC-F family ATP-binding cassette domain-containing protein [Dokdonella koreensis]ANB18819.1 ABC-type transporter [Dokdonella koreensis DS-123]
MANPFLALESASYVLPDGRLLFSGLTEQFDLRPTGLVGRNGVGKSVLARLLAGQLQPSAGRCLRSGSAYYLPQHLPFDAAATVADLAGVAATVAALGRIEAGSAAAADFEAVGERWDVRQRLAQALDQGGLGHLDAHTPAHTLSGGQVLRVMLAGAFVSDADFLILDEPSNHLDRSGRAALAEHMQCWTRGLLLVSHDRALLDRMTRTVELSSLGLKSYGGGYAFYAQHKAAERAGALAQLDRQKGEQRREERALRAQRERQDRRQARGDRHGREANQAPILLGRRKERSESTAGKLRLQQAAARDALAARVREAARQVEQDAPIALHAPAADAGPRRVAVLDAAVLPFGPSALRQIDWILTGGQRVGVVGPNGCGKSTLLKLVAGRLAPAAGRCERAVATAYLDQSLADLDPQRTALEHLRAANDREAEDVLRTRLAQAGLDARTIHVPTGALSGGERLKAALACAIHADPPAQLLLLDEPSNHLDLAAVEALEVMLRQYPGTLVVVSHDDRFLDQLALTTRLAATPHGWRLAPW